MTIHDGKCSLCGPHAQGQKPLQSQLILTLTLSLTYPQICRSRGNSKENVYLHGIVNYRHAINCRKLINVKCTDTSDLRHFGPKTFRHWCRNVQWTLRHHRKNPRHFGTSAEVSWTFRHHLQVVYRSVINLFI